MRDLLHGLGSLLDVLGVLACASLVIGVPWLFVIGAKPLSPARARLYVFSLIATVLLSLRVAHAAEVVIVSGDVIRVGDQEWRIANIDAPQIENTCEGEARLGVLAQAKLAEFLAQGEMEIRPTGEFDLRHRRMARIAINGEDVGEKMLAVRLAQRHGQARPLCYAANFRQPPRYPTLKTVLPPVTPQPPPPPPPGSGWVR